MTRKFRSTPLHALLAAAVLGLLVMPMALAGAAPKATSSVAVTAAKFKQLKQRIARLEARGTGTGTGTTTTPTGPAGGDLTGTYPNPQLGQGTVGSPEVINDSLAANDLAPNSVGTSEIATDGVGSDEIATNGVGISEIGADAVGADELKVTYVIVSGGVEVDANQFGDQTAQCNGSDQALGGGHSWSLQNTETHMVASTPDPLVQPNKWVVRGTSEANDNVLYAWVVCINA